MTPSSACWVLTNTTIHICTSVWHGDFHERVRSLSTTSWPIASSFNNSLSAIYYDSTSKGFVMKRIRDMSGMTIIHQRVSQPRLIYLTSQQHQTMKRSSGGHLPPTGKVQNVMLRPRRGQIYLREHKCYD